MTADGVIYEDDVFEISPKLCDRVIEVLENKQGVIIDHVITSERIYEQLAGRLSNYNTLLIHITCPLKELEKREAERNNRCTGSAKASFEYLFPKDGYDLTLDTFELTLEECCRKITELLYLTVQNTPIRDGGRVF